MPSNNPEPTASLRTVNAGDYIAPMSLVGGSTKPKWTGVIIRVTAVTPKRLRAGSTLIDKETGRNLKGSRGTFYVPATHEMVIEIERKQRERQQEEVKADAFRLRSDFQHAVAIRDALEGMRYDDHLLDRLTPEEWAAFHDKLTGARG